MNEIMEWVWRIAISIVLMCLSFGIQKTLEAVLLVAKYLEKQENKKPD